MLKSLGTCSLIITITLEIEFVVVHDKTIPGGIDLLIGWDVISRRGLRVETGLDRLELHHDHLTIPTRIMPIRSPLSLNFSQSGMTERQINDMHNFIAIVIKVTPSCVTTDELTIKLKDNNPSPIDPNDWPIPKEYWYNKSWLNYYLKILYEKVTLHMPAL